MVRNRPSGDAFGSNRRPPTLQRRRRDEITAQAAAGPPAAAAVEPSPSSSSSSDEEAASRSPSPPKLATSSPPRVYDESMTGLAEVSVEKKEGYFEIKGNMSMAVDPDITYGILTDYENNPQIFKTVSKVEVEYKDNAKMVTQHAHWNLLFWSGAFDMKMKVEEDRRNRAVSFKLNEPGFLKMFNGYWGIEPWVVDGKPMGSKVVVTQEVLPSLLPPGPLAIYVSRIMGNQVKAVLQDLSAEAERMQQLRSATK